MNALPRIDRRAAVGTGRRLVRSGPPAGRAEVEDVVRVLRRQSDRAADHVRTVSGLDAGRGTEVLVVNRESWIEANVESFGSLLEEVSTDRGGPLGRLGSRVAGVQTGALLSYLAPRVLGQFDPFAARGGRLLLVAPNVLQVERQLAVPPADFRLWVCLHEETHRVQFGHAPWLAAQLRSLLTELLAETDLNDAEIARRLLTRARERRQQPPAQRSAGSRPAAGTAGSLVEVVATAGQRERMDQITGIMSLLEGHADVMMDRVGPDVIASVRTIRARFTARRERRGLDRVLRRLLGLEAKLAQYREGARFVRHVVRAGGLDTFNTVFDSPLTLPSLAEIRQPQRWLARVG